MLRVHNLKLMGFMQRSCDVNSVMAFVCVFRKTTSEVTKAKRSILKKLKPDSKHVLGPVRQTKGV
jgi:hypothetical protein